MPACIRVVEASHQDRFKTERFVCVATYGHEDKQIDGQSYFVFTSYILYKVADVC